jgi:hypothetical protein
MRSRVELFEKIRRDRRLEDVSIRELADRHGTASLVLFLLYWQWRTLPAVIWDRHCPGGPVRVAGAVLAAG